VCKKVKSIRYKQYTGFTLDANIEDKFKHTGLYCFQLLN